MISNVEYLKLDTERFVAAHGAALEAQRRTRIRRPTVNWAVQHDDTNGERARMGTRPCVGRTVQRRRTAAEPGGPVANAAASFTAGGRIAKRCPPGR